MEGTNRPSNPILDGKMWTLNVSDDDDDDDFRSNPYIIITPSWRLMSLSTLFKHFLQLQIGRTKQKISGLYKTLKKKIDKMKSAVYF